MRKNPCSGEFAALLRHYSSRSIDSKWNRLKSIQGSPVLRRNFSWLKEHGFIVEKKENYKWVNVYLDRDKKPYFGNNDFETEKEAKERVTHNSCYTSTIQLKPKSEE